MKYSCKALPAVCASWNLLSILSIYLSIYLISLYFIHKYKYKRERDKPRLKIPIYRFTAQMLPMALAWVSIKQEARCSRWVRGTALPELAPAASPGALWEKAGFQRGARPQGELIQAVGMQYTHAVALSLGMWPVLVWESFFRMCLSPFSVHDSIAFHSSVPFL